MDILSSYSLLTYIISSLFFLFIPIWIVGFIIGYILQIIKVKKTCLIAPLSIIFVQLGLIHLYREMQSENLTLYAYFILSVINIIITIGIMHLKKSFKVHLYLIPVILTIAGIYLLVYNCTG